jgi:hypothetical protein
VDKQVPRHAAVHVTSARAPREAGTIYNQLQYEAGYAGISATPCAASQMARRVLSARPPMDAMAFRRLLMLLVLVAANAARARTSDDPVRLAWDEGDLAGVVSIRSADGRETLGVVSYLQRRRDGMLHTERVARYRDGSSDEDTIDATVGRELRVIAGRTVVRDAAGRAVVDLAIDVQGGRIRGTAGDRTYDEAVALPAGTYWGPLVFLVLKNFDQNATDGRLAFRTVVPTPAPRVLDVELVRGGRSTVERAGTAVPTVAFSLAPAAGGAADPGIQPVLVRADFLVLPGAPPALARFTGPRNFAGDRIRVE